MTSEKIAEHLWSTRAALEALRPPNLPGVYAWFLTASDYPAQLATLPQSPIYVGISNDLSRRELEDHFEAKSSGFSTLRRSLGALLKQDLELVAMPRSAGASVTNMRNYRFNPDGEKRLSAWMRNSLVVGFCQVNNPVEMESQLIALLCPPLNLTGWNNPQGPEIKRLRKACADEARGH